MITTVTLNAAVDRNMVIDEVSLGSVNRVDETQVDPGGKGINVSRVVTRLGYDTTALSLVGGLAQREVLRGRDTSVVLGPTHLRELPALSGAAGVEAQPGEVVRIVGRQGAWTRIELSDRRQGWVEARRLAGLEAGDARATGAVP